MESSDNNENGEQTNITSQQKNTQLSNLSTQITNSSRLGNGVNNSTYNRTGLGSYNSGMGYSGTGYGGMGYGGMGYGGMGYGGMGYGGMGMNQQPGQNPQGFRQEYQGILQGMQSMLGIAYASMQFATFSKIFASISKDVLNAIWGFIKNTTDKAFTLLYFKSIIRFILKLFRGDVRLDISQMKQNTGKVFSTGLVWFLRILGIVTIAICLRMKQVIQKQQQRKLEKELKEKEEEEQKQKEQEKFVLVEEESKEQFDEKKSEDFWPQRNEEVMNSVTVIKPNQIPLKARESVNYLADLPITVEIQAPEEKTQTPEQQSEIIPMKLPTKPWMKSTAKNPFAQS